MSKYVYKSNDEGCIYYDENGKPIVSINSKEVSNLKDTEENRKKLREWWGDHFPHLSNANPSDPYTE